MQYSAYRPACPCVAGSSQADRAHAGTATRRPWHRLSVGVAIGALGLLCGCSSNRKATAAAETYVAQRGTLEISVVESGNLEAAESIDIINRVSRTVRILEIVEEGTSITPVDVENKRVLVRFDDSELNDNLYERESSFESAEASLTEAKEALAIQKSENESNIRGAELALSFAVTDLRKLVGDKLAERYMDSEPESIAALLEDPDLGGQVLQDLRQFRSDIELEREELSRAREKLKWTETLSGRGFVTANEREADALALRRRELSLQSAEAKLDLYRRYEFVKQFQKTWATVLESVEKLERARAVARSRLAQAESRHSSRQADHSRERNRLAALTEDIENCTIRATRPGFVVYKSPPHWRNEGPLQVGSEVRSKHTIIEFPDLSRMVVKVDIHESQIDLVAEGQQARIRIDALPDRSFAGKVLRKAVLPSSQSRWLNPDLKVYETRVEIEGVESALRPGMTAEVEILIERIADVVYVPIQSVQTDREGKHFCYLADGTRRSVRIGKRNNVFVTITEGIEENERILLAPPELTRAND